MYSTLYSMLISNIKYMKPNVKKASEGLEKNGRENKKKESWTMEKMNALNVHFIKRKQLVGQELRNKFPFILVGRHEKCSKQPEF